MKTTILVTGADGMLGTDLVAAFISSGHYNVLSSTILHMDITNLRQVEEFFVKTKPAAVIHCAAYTAVDKAELEPETAYSINAEGTHNIAFACRNIDARMVYISTDYVFDGTKEQPYSEGDQPNPINVYGASKLRGERYMADILEEYMIVRVSWLNGVHCTYGFNFIETMLKLASKHDPLRVVSDQHGSPTFTFDLADAIVRLFETGEKGIFHITNNGITTWYDFARAVFNEFQISNVSIVPISTAEYKSAAKRPLNSVLVSTRLEKLNIPPLRHWQAALSEYHRRRNMIERKN